MAEVHTINITHHSWLNLLTLISCVYQVTLFPCFALWKQVIKHNSDLKDGEIVLYLLEGGNIYIHYLEVFCTGDLFSPSPFIYLSSLYRHELMTIYTLAYNAILYCFFCC